MERLKLHPGQVWEATIEAGDVTEKVAVAVVKTDPQKNQVQLQIVGSSAALPGNLTTISEQHRLGVIVLQKIKMDEED